MTEPALHSRLQWLTVYLLVIAVLVLELFPQIDFSISSIFFDDNRQIFPLADDELWREWLHHKLRYSLRPIQVLSVVLWLVSLFWLPLKKWRGIFSYFVFVSLFSAGLVAELKYLTQRACPYQLSEFGGTAIFQPLISGIPEVVKGKCWPGGHVLHAFTLFPIYFIAWRKGFHRSSLWILGAIIAFGTLLNITQIVRGQHFLSHNLWSMLISWLVALAFDRLWHHSEVYGFKLDTKKFRVMQPLQIFVSKNTDRK